MTRTDVLDTLDQLSLSQNEAESLIARYIQQDPHRPGRHEARVVTAVSSPQVWILIPYLRASGLDEVARAYELPREAVLAVIAYYQRNRELIDAKILLDMESSAA